MNSIQKKSNAATGLVVIGILAAVTFTALHYTDILRIPSKALPGLSFGALALTLFVGAVLISNMNTVSKNTENISSRLSTVDLALQNKQDKQTHTA